MSTLQVTTVTSPDANTPLILKTGNTSGGQIVLNAANTDIQMQGNFKFSNTTFAGNMAFSGNVKIGSSTESFPLSISSGVNTSGSPTLLVAGNNNTERVCNFNFRLCYVFSI